MDMTLNVNGNASGASAALQEAGGSVRELGDDVGKSVVKWQELVNVTKKAVELVVKFGLDAVKAYAESERVQKQLTRAAGEYADALSEQAEALSRKYAVDDDIIKQSQVLLTQWGGVGAATEDVTKAILNYAAATGQDATSATTDLIRNVESGGVGLAKLGVHFKATGDKGKDLAAAVGALNKKFGGAAAADADSLVGQTHAAELAFEDFQKNVGGAIAEMVRATGIVPKLTKEIRDLTDSLFTPTAKKQAESSEYIAQQVKYWEDITAGNVVGYKDFATKTQFTFEEAQAELAKWRAKLRPSDFNVTPSTTPTVTGTTNKGMKDAAGDQRSTTLSLGAALQGLGEITGKYTDKLNELQAAEVGTTNGFKGYLELTKQTHQAIKDATPSWNAWYAAWEKSNAKAMEKSRDKMAEWRAQMAEDNARAEQAQMKQWGQMGDAIGAAFVNGLAGQIEKLSSGGEIDVAVMVGDILASVIGIAATAIGTAYGAPQLGAAIGNLAAVGIRAGAGAISRGNLAKNRARTYHSGGWVGDEAELPRYHSGAWIGADEQRAILQTGERVLSRREVRAMGGPSGVDSAAQGGAGRVVVNIQAIDSKNASESLQTDLGKGMRTALRTGRGDLPILFAGTKGPR